MAAVGAPGRPLSLGDISARLSVLDGVEQRLQALQGPYRTLLSERGSGSHRTHLSDYTPMNLTPSPAIREQAPPARPVAPKIQHGSRMQISARPAVTVVGPGFEKGRMRTEHLRVAGRRGMLTFAEADGQPFPSWLMERADVWARALGLHRPVVVSWWPLVHPHGWAGLTYRTRDARAVSTVLVDPRSPDPEGTILHELMHVASPELSECEVERAASQIVARYRKRG